MHCLEKWCQQKKKEKKLQVSLWFFLRRKRRVEHSHSLTAAATATKHPHHHHQHQHRSMCKAVSFYRQAGRQADMHAGGLGETLVQISWTRWLAGKSHSSWTRAWRTSRTTGRKQRPTWQPGSVLERLKTLPGRPGVHPSPADSFWGVSGPFVFGFHLFYLYCDTLSLNAKEGSCNL